MDEKRSRLLDLRGRSGSAESMSSRSSSSGDLVEDRFFTSEDDVEEEEEDNWRCTYCARGERERGDLPLEAGLGSTSPSTSICGDRVECRSAERLCGLGV